MESVIAFVTAHKAELVAISGALYTLLSVLNGLIHSPKANTVLGDILDVISYVSRHGAQGSVKMPGTRSCAPGQPVVDGASARALLPLLLELFALSACAHFPSPDPAKYKAAFIACLEQQGITDATNAGAQILQILDTGSGSAAQIEAQVENVLVTIGGNAAVLVTTCAVDAWAASNPVPVSAKPSPAQAAARLFHARHLSAPTLVHP